MNCGVEERGKEERGERQGGERRERQGGEEMVERRLYYMQANVFL